ncbi:MAG: PD-(D/E)XK nuclease family protein, partial [Lachnospiraceae bacterium]|nr:PD-(D/E)XK nuclease family protein [Lachnospiraceae bacterium]
MATLKFVVGGAGSGKTTELCREVIEKAKQEPERAFLYLVPEQFTMQTQKALVDLQEEKAIMNIDVLSFQRLAYRVFDDLGVVNVPVLGENGKNLILRRVAQEEELSVLKPGLSSMGFITELKSFVSELMQYQITPEQLRLLSRDTGGSFFSEKCKDLAVLYEGFLKQIRGSFITTEEVLSLLIRYAPESKLIRESTLFLDGYTGFTPIQVKLLYTLFPLVSEVVVAVCADSTETIKKEPELTDLFYMSQKMTGQLMRIAADTESEILPPVVLEKPEKRRFVRSSGMAHLEQDLFRDESRVFTGETDAIRLTLAFHPRGEMEACAEAIRKLVAEEGYRYKEIAVVTGDLPVYAAYAGETFGKYQIPFFVDQNKTVAYHPLTEAVRGALYTVSENYSYESVFHYFRSGLTDYTPEEIDQLETWCLSNGIRRNKWKKEFEGESEDLPLMNEMRLSLLDSIEPLRKVFQKKNRKIEAVAKAVYEFLVRHKAWEKMLALAKKQEELQEEAKAAETSKIYKIVIEFLDKAAELLRGQEVTVEEFLELFDAALESEQVGVLPAGYDRVVIGDIERSRFQEIRALFFLGVNDGVVPKTGESGALISEQERELFSGHDMELAPGEKERVFIQRFYLYLNLTKPSERLFVSYAASDREGKPLRPSYLIMVLKKLFPGLTTVKYLPKPAKTKNADSDIPDRNISPELAHRLYGTEITAGVTRLENFASCAYRHFLRYALLLTERDLHEFRIPDLGNLIHDSLAVYGNELKDRSLSWKEIEKNEQERIIKYAFDKAKEPFSKAGF